LFLSSNAIRFWAELNPEKEREDNMAKIAKKKAKPVRKAKSKRVAKRAGSARRKVAGKRTHAARKTKARRKAA
jgi:hypothetical protein